MRRTGSVSRNAEVPRFLPERFDDNYVLCWKPESRFLNTMFREDDKCNHAVRTEHDATEDHAPANSPCHTDVADAQQSLIPHTTELASTGVRAAHAAAKSITFRSRDLNFSVRNEHDSLVIRNVKTLWITAKKNKTLSLGLKIEIPRGHFALLMYVTKQRGCFCVPDILDDEVTNPDIQIVNVTGCEQTVEPGHVDGYVRIYPYFVPEPWETVNMSPPFNTYFTFRSNDTIVLPSFSSRAVTQNCTHICEGSYTALIVGTRKLSRMGVLVEPMIWYPGVIPSIRIVNATSKCIRISKGTQIARIVFTIPGFSITSVPEQPIARIVCPSTAVTFKRNAFLS